MLENKTPDPNSQPLKIEDILAKAEEIRNARDRQSSVTNSDLGEAFKLFTVVDEESKLLTKKRDLFKPVKLFWNWTGFGEKKLWDIIQIVAVPSALAIAGFWFQDFTKKQEMNLAESKTKQELLVADSKAKQETLIKYLDQMSDLLEKGLLKSKHDSPIFIIAQSKTVTALQSLDPNRQHLVIQFLESANMNALDGGKGLLFQAKMSKAQLQKADLSGINLKGVDLRNANLEGADLSGANLNGANFSEANLKKANLNGSDLSFANLEQSNLIEANLREANLKRAELVEADLEKADLFKANLSEASLNMANLTETNLYRANLSNTLMLRAGLAHTRDLEKEQLEKASRPFICRVNLHIDIDDPFNDDPTKSRFRGIDDDRDCAAMPEILLKRYPGVKTLDEIKRDVEDEGSGGYHPNYRMGWVAK